MVSSNPQIRDDNSPLDALVHKALMRYAEFNPQTLDSETLLMFLEFANDVVDDINSHPYWAWDEVKYYTSPQEARPIPDRVMTAGLLAYYAAQQASPKVQLYGPQYLKLMNRTLWHMTSEGSGKIQVRIPDNGTNPANANGDTFSAVTGMPEDDA